MSLKINYAVLSSSVIAIINFGYKEFDPLKRRTIYKPLRYFTGIKLKPNEWDSKSKLPFDTLKKAELVKLEKQITDIFNYLSLKCKVDPDVLKTELDNKLKGFEKESVVTKVRIVDFISQHILTSDHLKKNSKPAYKNLANKLIDFEVRLGKKIYTNDVTSEFYQEFMEEMRSRLQRTNSVWSMAKVFKATLNEISRKFKFEVFNPTIEVPKRYRPQSTDIDTIYLTFAHIQKLLKYQPFTEKMKNTRMILLTLFFTGCRESDVYKIVPHKEFNDAGDHFYYCQYISEKTNTPIVVPILKPLLKIFQDNNFEPCSKISQQKFNVNVKELIEDCGLNEEITLTYIDSNGQKQFETKKFYQYVTSHIGRRSFVTNLINHIPITTLNKITGHTSRNNKQIESYNKISLLDNAVLFRKQVKRAVEENPDYFPFELV